MYTTLNTLKSCKACVGGFGRLLGFFGTSPEIKDKRIPLYAIALISGDEDFVWALDNACVFEDTDFKAFYERNLVSAWRSMFRSEMPQWKRSGPDHDKNKSPVVTRKQLQFEATQVETTAEVEELIGKLVKNRVAAGADHALWDKLQDMVAWKSDPHSFIKYCRHHIDDMDNITRKPVFASYKNGVADGVNVAHLFTDNPYDFIAEFPSRSVSGSKFEKKGGAYKFEFALKNPRTAFFIMQALSMKMDPKEDFMDNNEVVGGEQKQVDQAEAAWAPIESRTIVVSSTEFQAAGRDEDVDESNEEETSDRPRPTSRRRRPSASVNGTPQ